MTNRQNLIQEALQHLIEEILERTGCTCSQQTNRTMVAGTSVAGELLNALRMSKLWPMPSYISEADTVSIEDFMQSSYTHEYVLPTSNIHWGGELKVNHVFDIFAGYHTSRNSNKVRLEMLEYVTVNSQRYAWDCYTLLCMSRVSLSEWRAKITFWGNPADTMAVYALSDQFGLHTSVVTRSKLWTMIHADYQGTANDVLEISSIKLLYMGANRFGRLWKKAVSDQPSYYGPNFNYQPMLPSVSVPSTDDVETACTLVQIGDNVKPYMQDNAAPQTPLFEGPEVTSSDDAMDKIVGRLDVCSWKPLNCINAMDQVIKIIESLNINVETKNKPLSNTGVNVETKRCMVKLVRLDSILFDNLSDKSADVSEEEMTEIDNTATGPVIRSWV